MEEKLHTYRKKRDFTKTNEPSGRAARKKKTHLRFCVQHHIARNDHYDLRLEYGGVALSWAVPKGPSLDPSDKRLAMRVEDHPVEYMEFEGTIPKGEYGGGTVMLFDEGEWTPREDFGEGLAAGSLKFTLFGSRLKGDWALVRMKKEEDAWLLIKERDGYCAENAGIGQFKTGIRSGKTMAQIGAAGRENPFGRVEVMLATPCEALPKGEGWLFELKYDGHRTLAFAEGGKCRLVTRNGIDCTKNYRAAAQAVERMCGERAAVLDGEMVVTDRDGVSDFSALQAYARSGKGSGLGFVLFDLLALDGQDLRGSPLMERKAKLHTLLQNAPPILSYSTHVEKMTAREVNALKERGVEGIVAKRAGSLYTAGKNGDWRKFKFRKTEEFVVGGFHLSETGELKSLLAGAFREGELVFAGSVGTGFDAGTRKLLQKKLASIVQENPPFAISKRDGAGAVFVKPCYVMQVEFAELTRAGRLRQASFKGLREDKAPHEVEMPRAPVGTKLTHPEKVMFPKSGITKGDVAAYYAAAASHMLPYLKGRMLSLVCCPSGIEGERFFRRHLQTPFAGVKEIPAEDEPYFCVTGKRGILSLVQYNAVEFHMRGAKGKPDLMVFDLDPDEGVPLQEVRRGAEDVREVLEAVGLTSFLKTSGGKGYHIVVPFGTGAAQDVFCGFAKRIVELLEKRYPKRYTSSISKQARREKIFIDWQRNSAGATFAAPYTLRARENAPVSMPIAWEELFQISPDGVTMQDALSRMREKDPWENFFAVKKIQRLKQ